MIAYMKVLISFMVGIGIPFLMIKSTLSAPIPVPEVLYKQIDTNHDTFLDIDKLRQWIVDWIGNKSVEYLPMDKLLKDVDLDHDGGLSSDEMKKLCNDRHAMDWLNKTVPTHDTNNDGQLDKQELKRLLRTLLKKYFGEMAPGEALIPPDLFNLPEIYRKVLRMNGFAPEWYDLNNDGKMGVYEFGLAQIALAVLEMFNTDGDLTVSREEFGNANNQRKLFEFFATFEAELKATPITFQLQKIV